MAPTNPETHAEILANPERLALIEKLDLVDTLPEEVFDRLTRLAARLLPTPVVLVSIVDDRRQFFKSFLGLEEPFASARQTPLTHSFCQHVVVSGEPFIVEDARKHPLVKDNLAIPDLGVISYLGMPLTLKNGHTLGSFCVIDSESRTWSQDDIETVRELAQSVITEIELRREVLVMQEVECEREQLVQELEKANHDLMDFAYIVSHDLKAPLRGIRSIADWLSDDYANAIDDDGQAMLALLDNRVDRMQNLIEGVLRYSRVGRIEDEWEEIDIQEMLNNLIISLAPPDHIEIIVQDNMPTIYGGYIRIEQVFQNLISNAIKFMDKPNGLIEITHEKQENGWCFRVSDNGPGIDETYFNKIFQMFQTLNARDEFESTGIGLTIVKKIVEMHGGKIDITSQIGEGTQFTFTIADMRDNLP